MYFVRKNQHTNPSSKLTLQRTMIQTWSTTNTLTIISVRALPESLREGESFVFEEFIDSLLRKETHRKCFWSEMLVMGGFICKNLVSCTHFICYNISVMSHFNKKFFFFKFIYFWEREKAQVGEGQTMREKENPKQAVCCQRGAWCGAWIHKPWDHDLSWSQTLNPLSHPGVPNKKFLKFLITLTTELN